MMQGGARAGLVGTNTIRQNYSRIGSLDYIVNNGGMIYDAVSSMPWSGEANVHVSIANWSKGAPPLEPTRLHFFVGANEAKDYVFRTVELPQINSSLSEKTDVSSALQLTANQLPKRVYQGVIPGNKHFVLAPKKAAELVKGDTASKTVLVPLLIGRDLVARPNGQPSRYVIDLSAYDIVEAQNFRNAYRHVRREILPMRKSNAEKERKKNERARQTNPNARLNRHHENFLRQWWKLSYGREDMLEQLGKLRRFVGCPQTTKRPIFDFISTRIRPDAKIQVFAFEDDYTFGLLQSNAHWQWFIARCTTLKSDWSYASSIVFDTFPFPQHPTPNRIEAVADAGRALHEFRRDHMALNDTLTLRSMYRSLEEPGNNPLRDLHAALDQAVLAAYGFDPDRDILEQLLALNFEVAAKIEAGEAATAPGIPPDYPDPSELISDGCIQPPDWF